MYFVVMHTFEGERYLIVIDTNDPTINRISWVGQRTATGGQHVRS